jgi:hypothetical protein
LVYVIGGGGVGLCVYFCGSLLSTQKRVIKKRLNRTKKSNKIMELNIIIGDRLDLWR